MQISLDAQGFARLGLFFFLSVLICSRAAGQTTTQTPPQKPPDEVVRVYTELVQTDVMVFDRQGHFVDGLDKENFELLIDGKPKPIEAFEKITAGSSEESQLAAARGATSLNLKRPAPLDRGRTVFFYVDDFHMDVPGMAEARRVINTFIDKQMGQNDQAAVTSATGQIGFLQQLTNDHLVLHKAVDRLMPGNYSTRDFERPRMSEYEAVLIGRGDRAVTSYFVSETIRQNPGMDGNTAAQIVRSRSEVMQAQAAHFSANMLGGLESLVKTARNLPGRKVLFFLSGGFLLQNERSDTINRLRKVTDAAAKSGVVIYSMDTRGLVYNLRPADEPEPFDTRGQLALAQHSELSATQDGLNALAVDTGGKALFNTNDLAAGLAPAMKETSAYYLLAWKPDPETQKQGRFRQLEVKVSGRPQLTVRVRKGFFDLDPPAVAETSKDKKSAQPVKTAGAKLREAITSPYPVRTMPILMNLDYYDIAGKGPTLTTAVQIPGEFLSFVEQPNGKIQAIVDVSGIYFDEKGVSKATFVERITTTASSLEAAKKYDGDITYSYPANLPPGLYQVRAAARDDKSGLVGSAQAWVEVPDLSKKQLTMSSVMLGERVDPQIGNAADAKNADPVSLSASHRFKRDSSLRFLIFTYNAKLSPADQKPDVAVQVQVIREDQPVLTTALQKITTEGIADVTRLPYGAELPMSGLLPGRYVLRVSVIDRIAKQSTTQQTHFDVY